MKKQARRAASPALPCLLAVALGAAVATPARADSLAAIYDSARGYDAAWQSARAQYDAAGYRAEQARAGLLPSAGVQANAARSQFYNSQPREQLSISSQTASVTATQPIYRPINVATYEQAKRGLALAESQLTQATQDLVIRVSQAYFDVLGAQDTLTFVRAQKTAVSEQLAAAKRNFEVGTATITDTREAQARYDLVISQEIAAENDLRIKKLALDTLVGRPDVKPDEVTIGNDLPGPVPADVNSWVDQSDVASPFVVQARAALDVAKLETQKARDQHKPTLDLALSYTADRYPNGSTVVPNPTRDSTKTVALVFNMPIFEGFAIQNRVRETLSLEEKAAADLENARRTVAQSTRTAYYLLLSGVSQVKALQAAEASSQVSLEANQLGYQVGVRINIDVLNAQSQLYQTKRDLALARYAVLLEQLKLRQANGTLVPDDLARLGLIATGH